MVDVRFDCRTDAAGRDPDSHSPTLRRFHKILWSKSLPNGRPFDLDISGPKPFLVHSSEIGEFHLTSDSITHFYSNFPGIGDLIKQLPVEQRRICTNRGWVISECIVFPGKRINGQNTINGVRGMNHKVKDRFDLTLECIRRHYLHAPSPLSDVLSRYSEFFALFESFQGYVDFFLLQDLVTRTGDEVKFFLPFTNFEGSPLPRDLQSYQTYIEAVDEFSSSRASRIVAWCRGQGTG